MTIDKAHCPAMGDIRALGKGDMLFIYAEARERADWSRVSDAVRQAMSRGCGVVWL